MTEAEWRKATDPNPMLKFLRGKACDRKLRLFACACCAHPRCHAGAAAKMRALAENWADRSTLWRNVGVQRARLTIWSWSWSTGRGYSYQSGAVEAEREALASLFLDSAAEAAKRTSDRVCFAQYSWGKHWAEFRERRDWESYGASARASEEERHAGLLRDIFHPFHTVALQPAGLTGNVRDLAQTIYDGREMLGGRFDNGRLAVLADALEEAGCDNADVLDHCREPGEHVRGCWVIDAILGKE